VPLDTILRHSPPVNIHDTEVELRARISLIGSRMKTLMRLDVVPKRALTVFAHRAKIVLGHSRVLFGSNA